MTFAPDDFRRSVQDLLAGQGGGVVLTERELSHLAERYPLCGGKSPWDVRAYARFTGRGAREYRVVRGTSVLNVYRSDEPEHAAAVRTALNALETPAPAAGGGTVWK
jgi:hypothetical protein